jgi:hypothetical protein
MRRVAVANAVANTVVANVRAYAVVASVGMRRVLPLLRKRDSLLPKWSPSHETRIHQIERMNQIRRCLGLMTLVPVAVSSGSTPVRTATGGRFSGRTRS